MTNDLGKASNNSNLTGRRLGLFAMVAVGIGLVTLAAIDIFQGIPNSFNNQPWVILAVATIIVGNFSGMIFNYFYQKSSVRKSFYGAMYKIFFVFSLVSIGFCLYLFV